MNKIVRQYPVDQLPADLRDGLPEHGWVEIEFRPKERPQPRVLLAHWSDRLKTFTAAMKKFWNSSASSEKTADVARADGPDRLS
jgi:hypothetical protein